MNFKKKLVAVVVLGSSNEISCMKNINQLHGYESVDRYMWTVDCMWEPTKIDWIWFFLEANFHDKRESIVDLKLSNNKTLTGNQWQRMHEEANVLFLDSLAIDYRCEDDLFPYQKYQNVKCYFVHCRAFSNETSFIILLHIYTVYKHLAESKIIHFTRPIFLLGLQDIIV